MNVLKFFGAYIRMVYKSIDTSYHFILIQHMQKTCLTSFISYISRMTKYE